MRTIACWLLAVFLFGGVSASSQSSAELQFLTNHTDYKRLREQLANYEQKRAFDLLDAREARVAAWGPADAQARKAEFREKFIRLLGGFPEKTPLNARITGTIDAPDYRIEKIIFESQPRFYVTANLYLPKTGKAPYPAILFPLGHEDGAKSHDVWQQILVTFARKGYVCLTWDPLGQGERVQIFDADLGGSKTPPATTEHTVLGTQTLLAGTPLARYTIWDGIRALDYLESRPEVDKKRIGLTGNSGGGTHTAYIASLDDRIQVAAPSCFITSWRRLLLSIGPQDAEQCVPGFLAEGLDHADFIYGFAPKPYRMLSAIRDFFSITGARETFAEAQRVYGLLGAPDHIAMTEADNGHGYLKERRLAAYKWFDKWLKGVDQATIEEPVVPRREEELWATKTGQVTPELNGETVSSLNRALVAGFHHGSPTPAQIRRMIGYEPVKSTPAIKPFGTLHRTGYRIEKLTYLSEPGMETPALLYLPDGNTGKVPAVVYVNSDGKSAAAGDLESLVKQGFAVLSLDARGFGETRDRAALDSASWSRYFGDYSNAMTAMLAGHTLTGARAADISRAIDLLVTRPEIDVQRIYGAGRKFGGIAMLHAAALDSRIKQVALEQSLESYQSVVDHQLNRGIMEHVVPGALRVYDLPDLARMLGGRQLVLVDTVDPVGNLVAPGKVAAAYPGAKLGKRYEDSSAATLYGFPRP
ncbi:MAG: acetylxylan esterase [Bryobacterales bacterium]|nr:acetylxylan esterase [Bryobacterales bacterium]